MLTTHSNIPIFNKGAVMAANAKPNLNEVVRRIRALRALSKSTGFSTNRTVCEMLERLSQEDLVSIGEAFLLTPNDAEDGK